MKCNYCGMPTIGDNFICDSCRYNMEEDLNESSTSVEEVKEIIAGILYENKSDEGDEGCWINSEDFYEVAEIIASKISAPLTGESEAIGMIKWIRENYEPEFGDGRHWEDILDEAETPISDKELYNLYKQSKK